MATRIERYSAARQHAAELAERHALAVLDGNMEALEGMRQYGHERDTWDRQLGMDQPCYGHILADHPGMVRLMREYDYMECCASGSCEVCKGLQGIVRAEANRKCWRSECRNECYYPDVCSG